MSNDNEELELIALEEELGRLTPLDMSFPLRKSIEREVETADSRSKVIRFPFLDRYAPMAAAAVVLGGVAIYISAPWQGGEGPVVETSLPKKSAKEPMGATPVVRVEGFQDGGSSNRLLNTENRGIRVDDAGATRSYHFELLPSRVFDSTEDGSRVLQRGKPLQGKVELPVDPM